ncbi:MAG: hypothetical protein KatS3mg114_0258 [Planctomycetaceae bacterium]|nr:MAG: hypothetical protein KatS3mg114_0258 [Planctomycetaceae bacterium]
MLKFDMKWFTWFLLAWSTFPSGWAAEWSQWRGPNRDGTVAGSVWPDTLTGRLVRRWQVPLGPSYSGPVMTADTVFTTETQDQQWEVVTAWDRATGQRRWQTRWAGAMQVPFFAASRGSWIRATPACDGERLYVAGMRDVLVCLDGHQGKELWRVDFVQRFGTPLPAFGFVSSPLVTQDAVYVQAGAAVVKLDKFRGEILWRTLEDEGGMQGSAFSSPVIATLAGQPQLVVQTRRKLAGIDLDSGRVLWTHDVPAYRGMNILTPLVHHDTVFTSSYRNKAWLYEISADAATFRVKTRWEQNTSAYMSSPVLIGDHVYVHLQNQRFACLDLKTGERRWTSQPFGQYASLVTDGHKILALDQTGWLYLIDADPSQFVLRDAYRVSDTETWGHLAVSGQQLYIRAENGLSAWDWQPVSSSNSP